MSIATPPRPNLLPTAALVSLLVLLLGAAALFALSSTNEKSLTALARLDQLHAAQVAAVEARVNFKTQVQEWKNILLRGRNATDFASYRKRFQEHAVEVQTGLTAVEKQLAALGLDASGAARLITEHQTLGVTYEKALAGFRPEDATAPFAIDASIRGVDRKLNDDIDALARTVEQAAAAELKSFGETAADRYATLRKITLGIGGAAMLAAFWLVFQATRTTSAA